MIATKAQAPRLPPGREAVGADIDVHCSAKGIVMHTYRKLTNPLG